MTFSLCLLGIALGSLHLENGLSFNELNIRNKHLKEVLSVP